MTSEARVLSFIHYTHAAAAKPASYDIVRDGLPDYGFHDSRTGKDSSCKPSAGQGDSGLREPFTCAWRFPLPRRWTRYVEAVLAVVDSSAVSPLTRNCARRVPARVHLEVSPLPAHAFQKRGCGAKYEALNGSSATPSKI